MLPILPYRQKIIDQLLAHKKLIVTAPPGTGKSTQIPQFLFDNCTPQKQLVVLEPRRIAARSLAFRVAEEMGQTCGCSVGYQVRFEKELSADTRILFCTYGTFLQLLQTDPQATFASIIIFDEFHERSLEADMALAWASHLCSSYRPDLMLMILSATLEIEPLQHFLGTCGIVNIPEKSYPVAIMYQAPKALERLPDQVARAFLMMPDSDGSILVFLPGVYEIERVAETLFDTCKKRGYRILQLHGRMTMDMQQEALHAPSKERCIIFATNIAETSLTIPGVTTVIDSGIARVAAYDAQRDRNTLYVSRISLQNATQRAGRAGRICAGTCIKLWSKDDEHSMPKTIVPEITRLDLAKCALTLYYYATILRENNSDFVSPLQWLTPPAADRWEKADNDLDRCGALDCTTPYPPKDIANNATFLRTLTPLGKKISSFPIEPVIATILLQSSTKQEMTFHCAMAALWESGESKQGESQDLFDLAESFLQNKKSQEFGRELHETYRQLEGLVYKKFSLNANNNSLSNADLRIVISKIWMKAFSHRIAGKVLDGTVYELADGKSIRLIEKKKVGLAPEKPLLIVALSIHEQAGKAQTKKVSVPLYLPLTLTWVAQEFKNELQSVVECRWDEAKKRVVLEKITKFRNVICSCIDVQDPKPYLDNIAACLANRLLAGDWNWKIDEPKAEQFLFRMKLVASTYPDMKIPTMTTDDWELVYHDFCCGKKSLDDVKNGSVLLALKSYCGPHLTGFIENKAPETIALQNGKKARITYFDTSPPELSARLGDLIGYKSRFTIMDNRVQGVFDILAPNYRTVQKTADLGAFWTSVYPEIKNALKRKYPKHPWP